ncbi:MAG: ABC transporter ATP-binding protein [Rhodobacteraceae bacterium]|nr:ABC transporter ATP-binding protein [Paracoccaceae bacterium]
MSSVELKSIVKKYGEVTAVASIDLSVESGEFVTLLGPSGCGKTTTLRMVAGFIRPTSGTLSIGDVDMTGVPPHQRTVGLVFQNYALFPHMTVRKNVEFGLKMQKVLTSERGPRVQEALELVQLEALGERMPGELSGGQQQRVALARALVIRPDVLLLDEPFGALDKQLRDHMRVELRELQQKLKISTLFVTHDQDEALSMSDRIVVMSEGEVSQVGKPTEIYEKPQTRFVADFIGRSNILLGKLENKGKTINAEGLTLPNKENVTSGSEGVSVMIRPECVEITKSESKATSPSADVKGKITASIYLGSIVQYSVQIIDGPNLVVTQNNTGSEDLKNLTVGDDVDVSFPDSAVYILPG